MSSLTTILSFHLGILLSLLSGIGAALPACAEGEKATLNFPFDRKIPQLKSVSLTACKFSPVDLAGMRKALPKCMVQDRLDSRGEQWKVDVFDQSKP